jgi:phospholipase/carboxylesterase
VNPHLSGPVMLYGAPVRSARVVVVLLHGRTQSPADMEQQIVRRIALPDVAYVAPAADGNSWYPAPFMKPVEENQPRLGFALDRISALSDDLVSQGIPLREQVVMGFSQGACLGCEYVYRRGCRVRALVAFTGGLIGPPGTEWNPTPTPPLFDRRAMPVLEMPVLIEGSDGDPFVPAARMQETAAVFTRMAAAVALRLYPSTEHAIGDAQIDHARALLAGLRAPEAGA